MNHLISDCPPIVGTRFLGLPDTLSLQGQRRVYLAALVLSDTLTLGLAFLAAFWFRFRLRLPLFDLAVQPSQQFYFQTALMLVGIWLVLFYLFQLYEWENLLGGTREYTGIANASTVAMVLIVAANFLSPYLLVARGWLLIAWLLTILLPVFARFGLRRLVYRLRRCGYFMAPTLIVGTNREALALSKEMARAPQSGLHIVGLVSGTPGPGQAIQDVRVLGGLKTLPELIAANQVEEVIVCQSSVTPDELLHIYRSCGVSGQARVRFSSGLADIINTGLSIKSLGCVPLVGIGTARLSRLEGFLKGCLDLIGATCGLLVMSPVLLAIAAAIRLDSPGPVIYRRRVLGLQGKQFDAYKFRTMYADGDRRLTDEQLTQLRSEHKLKDDPRVTRVGRFLRKYSLDELPQLFNVLKGQMSLIGPRMITPAESDKYGHWDTSLFSVKPGLSGLWQVSGRSDIGYEERVMLDVYYIRNYTIWLDIALILRTFAVVVKGKGAY